MTKKYALGAWRVALVVLCVTACSVASARELAVLVVRGGHYYDTPEFDEMCQHMKGVKCDIVLTAHLENMTAAEIGQKYAGILFLNENKYYKTSDKHRKQYMDLAKLGVGMVFLHFTLSSQPEWDGYHDLVGGKWYLKEYEKDEKRLSTYFTDLTLDIKVLDPDHPVTKGLKNFTMTDAYYGNIYMASSVHPLLGTNHSGISQVIAWTHQYDNAKVVYIMPGFTKSAYENESYRKLLENALSYVAKIVEQ